MAKKDHAQLPTLEHLNKDARKRLEKLGEEWDKGGGFLLEKLTTHDLRLLLESFRPLHDLIRHIATTAPGNGASKAPAQAAQEDAYPLTESGRNTCAEDNQALQQQLADCQQELTELRRQLRAKEKQQAKLTEENRRLIDDRDSLVSESSQLRIRLREQTELPPVLDWLHREPALAERLGLAKLPNDASQGLIRCVAVLSRLDNIERLWDALKEKCEHEHRPASTEESALLQTALDWHNHNWQKKPFSLHRPAQGKSYDYSKEQRAASTPSGESLTAIWLPGILSGNGDVQKKALVTTQ